MSTQATNICYYSNKCQWSKAFITELSKTSWKNQFRFMCVDASPNRQPLPSWLKKVPTIVVAGEPEPRTDSDVMNWLYEKRMKEGEQNGAPPAQPGAGEPDPFNMMEQTSFTKGFSYSGVDADTSSQGTGGMTMPGAFAFLGGGAGEGDRLSQDSGGGQAVPSQRRSKKEEMFDKQMESYQRDRDVGMPKPPAGRL
jgi:hypothetical protein